MVGIAVEEVGIAAEEEYTVKRFGAAIAGRALAVLVLEEELCWYSEQEADIELVQRQEPELVTELGAEQVEVESTDTLAVPELELDLAADREPVGIGAGPQPVLATGMVLQVGTRER